MNHKPRVRYRTSARCRCPDCLVQAAVRRERERTARLVEREAEAVARYAWFHPDLQLRGLAERIRQGAA